ncbi:MAG: BMP family ABC transporter substrate-binding protein [Chloroflexi bacterium]|nr:BMP family ABC transporter substrate-binding protein [Chloroflexota bacterium]MCY3581465.1 BMP family ABC transporter substrate-binding protein [Chloroflexota bacterium]MCY3717434.1 BMP family ABC transporter substrate-binding protein [Chloroflexota bacterium]MDE2651214.1 BMP family ABC transporter substrate-binding protein [Chloroflexota bacterium]MXX52337.1 BMP family ABC transporter substrate-binding protein [Chloroflexota bacterium]
MRKLSFLLVVALVFVTAFAATAQDPLRVVSVVNGTLGDKSFFDSAQRGMDAIADEYDIEIDTVELGIDPANWEPGLLDVMSDSDSYDILIAGTFQMIDYLAANAHLYPDKLFIFYDAPMPYDNMDVCVEGCANVYSMTYAQNQGSFLAGVYAAAITTSMLEGTNDAPIIGAVGGQQIPVIDDFIVGYEQGACLVNPDTQSIVQYAGSWNDPARGKEITLAMYEQGADIVFQIAGGTGVGVFEAAHEQEHYAIGVDSDQATIVAETDPDQAERILTSMMKNVDNSIFRAITLHLDGELPYGSAESLGIPEGGVGLAKNEFYDAATSDDIRAMVEAAEAAVVNGDIEVQTVFTSEDMMAAVGTACADMSTADMSLADMMGDM